MHTSSPRDSYARRPHDSELHESNDSEDPLTKALAPPPGETVAERASRLHRESEAKRVSEQIDAYLKEDRRRQKEVGNVVKILLLGQSESGKSTTLKTFQHLHTPQAFAAELASWRLVIQLNLVKNVHNILEALASYEERTPSLPYTRPPSLQAFSAEKLLVESMANSKKDLPILGAAHKVLQMRLSPLSRVEESLVRLLVPDDEMEPTRLGPVSDRLLRKRRREIWIRAGAAGSGAFDERWKSKIRFNRKTHSPSRSLRGHSPILELDGDHDICAEPARVISACKEDMKALWEDQTVRKILELQGLILEDMPGFFLNSLDRIAQLDYVPSTQDVIRARLKTIGVSEWVFKVESSAGIESGATWRMFDVGGTRTQRHAWVPYFEDINAIIFLAPLSAFDQNLAEDPSVNRLEDSLRLWKDVCSNKMLAKADLILFLNKIDILEAKINAGIQVKRFVKSYCTREKDRKNEYEPVTKYFRSKFIAIEKEHSPLPERSFYHHLTCATDIRAMSVTIQAVRDTIMKVNLKAVLLV